MNVSRDAALGFAKLQVGVWGESWGVPCGESGTGLVAQCSLLGRQGRGEPTRHRWPGWHSTDRAGGGTARARLANTNRACSANSSGKHTQALLAICLEWQLISDLSPGAAGQLGPALAGARRKPVTDSFLWSAGGCAGMGWEREEPGMSQWAQVSTPAAHTPWAEEGHGSFACPSSGTLHWVGGTLALPPWCWERSSCCAQGMDVFKTQPALSGSWICKASTAISGEVTPKDSLQAQAASMGQGSIPRVWVGWKGCRLLPPHIPQQLSFPVPASPAEAVVQGNGFGFCSL